MTNSEIRAEVVEMISAGKMKVSEIVMTYEEAETACLKKLIEIVEESKS
jgi:hypothetical protein